MVYRTFIKIEKKGSYTFKLSTQGKAFVKLHQINLLDADFDYKNGETIQKTTTLDAGYHPLTIYYLSNQQTKGNLKMDFSGEDGISQSLSGKTCFY